MYHINGVQKFDNLNKNANIFFCSGFVSAGKVGCVRDLVSAGGPWVVMWL